MRGAFSGEAAKALAESESEADDERFHKLAVLMGAEEEE